jgi:hypothetical protein
VICRSCYKRVPITDTYCCYCGEPLHTLRQAPVAIRPRLYLPKPVLLLPLLPLGVALAVWVGLALLR